MSLYQVDQKYDYYFDPKQDYLELWKLEVLENYRHKGFGKKLVDLLKALDYRSRLMLVLIPKGSGKRWVFSLPIMIWNVT